MNKRNKVVAVITSILLAASMASLSIPAQAEQNTDVAPMSCPEIGHHQSVSNKGRIFMAGSLPKNWWDIHCNKSQNYNGHWECYRRSGC